MKHLAAVLLVVLSVRAALPAETLPHLQKTGAVTQMIVDGRPYLMLAGELHNSSASSTAYMQPVWRKLAALNLNTVIGTVSWELLEPEEGHFDFTLVDDQIQEARRHEMRLVLIWFGTWKNTSSSYVPLWVKKDPKRFPLAGTKGGGTPGFMGMSMDALSAFSEATLQADAKAFRALMRHIREVDPEHTVVMMQVENETGLLGDSRDHSALAEAAWSKPVPTELLRYLEAHKAELLPEVKRVWTAHGSRTSGVWAEVFGTDAYADEIFMAWHIGQYVGKVTAAGKAELAIPMYVNAWLGPQPRQDLPGQYPSGGPVSGMIDVWRAAAPAIDLYAADIYVEDFQGVCASYARSGNPLFIPEARASLPNLFWAIGKHAALGYSPFGIDDLDGTNPLGDAYAVLAGIQPLLAKYQPEGKVTAIEEGSERETNISFAGFTMKVRFAGLRQYFSTAPEKSSERGYALLISTAPDEIVIVGSRVVFMLDREAAGSKSARIGSIDEGRFEQGLWVPGRRLNGDENFSGNLVALPDDRVGVLKVKLYRME